jgi:hypothetical protein
MHPEIEDNLAVELEADWGRIYGLSRQLEANGFISKEAFRIVDAINTVFDAMPDDSELLWTKEAVRDCAEWHRIRRLARRLLRSLAASEKMRVGRGEAPATDGE